MMLRTSRVLAIAVLGLLVSETHSRAQDPTETSPQPITSCGKVWKSSRLANDLKTSDATCLTVYASGITIDGDGHRITAAQFAIQWIDRSGVTVKNVVSGQGLQMYGGKASYNLVTDSTFGWIGVYRGDDNVIQNSKLGKLAIKGMGNDPAQRATVIGNSIETTLTRNEEKVFQLSTGTDGTTEPDGTYHCARGDHLVMNNLISGKVVATDPATEPELLYIKCGSNSTISGNTIRANKRAAGILLRDNADDNLIADNDVWVGNGNEGALLIQSGSSGYHHPRNNTFQRNDFRVTNGRVFWLQAGATRGNVFLGNVFRSDNGASEAVRLTDGPGVDTLFDHNYFSRGGPGTLLVFRNLGPGTHRFVNNIFAYAGGSHGIFDFDKLQDLNGYKANDNVFYNQAGPVMFTQYGVDFPHWQYYTSQDQDSVEVHSDPMAP